MADTLTEIDIDVLQAAIESDIKAAFPAFQTVEFYSEVRSGLPLPACLLEIAEWQAGEFDPGTEQQPVMARFEARIIIGGVHVNSAKHTVRRLAAGLSAFVRARRWTDAANPGKTLPTGAAEFIGAYHDQFTPELDQYEVWRVEWQQQLDLGESVWKGVGVIPQHVFVGIAPDIGPGNEPAYGEVTQAP